MLFKFASVFGVVLAQSTLVHAARFGLEMPSTTQPTSTHRIVAVQAFNLAHNPTESDEPDSLGSLRKLLLTPKQQAKREKCRKTPDTPQCQRLARKIAAHRARRNGSSERTGSSQQSGSGGGDGDSNEKDKYGVQMTINANSGSCNSDSGVCRIDGKWRVCVDGGESSFGDVIDEGCGYRCWATGVTITRDGKCKWAEHVGGFDGFFSTDAGDGHEDGMAQAVKELLDDSGAEVGEQVGRGAEKNKYVNAFMKELMDIAEPRNLDYPEHQSIADKYVRVQNVERIDAACKEIIFVQDC